MPILGSWNSRRALWLLLTRGCYSF